MFMGKTLKKTIIEEKLIKIVLALMLGRSK